MTIPGSLIGTLFKPSAALSGSTPSTATARYWRIYQATPIASGQWQFDNFSMVGTVDSTGAYITATASNTTAKSLRTGLLDRVVTVADFFNTDGPHGIFGDTAAGEWLKVDFGAPVTVTSATLKNRYSSLAPAEYDIQYSTDNVNWVTIKAVTDTSTTLQTVSVQTVAPAPAPAPGSSSSDTYYSNVSLLLHAAGTNGSTSIVDSAATPNTMTANGSAQISTEQKKFGSASLKFYQGGSSVTAPASTALTLGTGDFTFECWVYQLTGAGYQTIMNIGNYASGILFRMPSTTQFDVWCNGQNQTFNYPDMSARNVWRHVALVRSSGVFKIYIDGVKVSQEWQPSPIDIPSGQLMLGCSAHNGSEVFSGYLDEVRLTKGVARYSGSTYTVPSSVFPPGIGVAPVADFTSTSTSGDWPLSVTFTDTSTNTPASWLWNFGDGSTSTSQNPVHTYAIPGSYSVSLTSSNEGGESTKTVTSMITVTGEMPAGFRYWRLYQDTNTVGNSSGYQWHLNSFSMEAAAADGSIVMATTSNTTASSIRGDSSLAAFFASGGWGILGNHTAGEYLKVDFGQPVTVLDVTVRPVTASTSHAPTAYSIQYSADGVNWLTSATVTTITSNVQVTNVNTPAESTVAPDPYYSNVSLLLHADGTNGGTSFVDNSSTPKTVTAMGSAIISTSAKKWGTGSLYINAANSYLSVPSSTDFEFGSGDFTIETWANTSNITGGNQTILTIGAYNSGLLFRLANSTTIEVWINGTQHTFSTSLLGGKWYHIAVSRSNGSLKMFVNGTQVGSAVSTTASIPAGALYVGMSSHNGGEYFTGYLDDFRITKGVARYTSNFIRPTASFANSAPAPTDSYFANVKFLAHYDTTTTDTLNHAEIASYSASISSTQSKFGGSSLYFPSADVSGKRHVVYQSNDFLIGTQDFTLEGWIYPTSGGVTCPFAVNGYYVNGNTVNGRDQYSGAVSVFNWGGNLEVIIDGQFTASGPAIALNQWSHIAVSRSGGTVYVSVNGVVASASKPVANIDRNYIEIGDQLQGASYYNSNKFTGYIDDVRLTIGTARYTSNFTVPTAAFPNS